jgi:hypothetical protein
VRVERAGDIVASLDPCACIWHIAKIVRSLVARAGSLLARRMARVLAVSTILVHLAGTVGIYLHFAVVAHERCPLHGELVHRGHGGLIADSPPLVPESGRSTVERGCAGADESHDDCSLATALRRRAVEPVARVTQPVSAARRHSRSPSLSSPLARRRDVYRVAPKTSPPRAA